MRGDAAQRDGQKDDCGKPQTEDKSKQHIFTPRFILSNRAPPYFRAARFFSFRLPFGSQPSAFSSADSATGSADFKRPSKREVLSLHRRNLREIHLIYCLDRKTPKKRLPLRGRGACRPRCGRQASGTPKVWHGAAVTEGVRQARPLSEFAQNFEFAHLLFFVFIFDIFAFVKFNFERLPS